MATFTGTQNADTITPDTVSPGVVASPPGSKPGDGDDSIKGELGKDTLDGAGGNDTILGGDNEDSILGGTGDDSLKGEESKDTVAGGEGNDTIDGGNGEDVLSGDDGNDLIKAGESQDKIFGGAGDDTLEGGNGDGTIEGGGGNDKIVGGKQQDVIAGGQGGDSIESDQGTDTVFGGSGADTIKSDQGGDLIAGGTGNDSIDAGQDDDTVVWLVGGGNDTIDLGGNNDRLALEGWTGPEVLPGFGSGATLTYGDWVVTGKQEDLTFTYTPTGESLSVKFNTNQDKVIKASDIICFYPGTLIRTPQGEVAVESLRHGDLVLTAEGEAKPIRFMFRQSVAARFADPLRALPIRIRAGALGENLPARDLLVSPAHAVLVEGVLVQAGALVNGQTILRETQVPAIFTYWHIEMADHALILAEGVPAETFLDSSERENFDNWAEYQAVIEGAQPVAEMPLPRARSHRQVPAAVRAHLAARIAALQPQDAAAAA